MSVHRMIVAAALAVAAAAPAAAQEVSGFDAELVCGGIFNPGDVVPVEVTLQELAGVEPSLDLRLGITGPDEVRRRLVNRTVILGENQTVSFTRNVTLPAEAPVGEYLVEILVQEGSTTLTDFCTFTVEEEVVEPPPDDTGVVDPGVEG